MMKERGVFVDHSTIHRPFVYRSANAASVRSVRVGAWTNPYIKIGGKANTVEFLLAPNGSRRWTLLYAAPTA
jgi:hypothetical protein